jgi:hypothetical protein
VFFRLLDDEFFRLLDDEQSPKTWIERVPVSEM